MCLFRWIFQAAAPLLKTPLSQAQQQAYSAAAATYTAVAGMRAAYGAAAAAQPVAGYAAVAGWVQETEEEEEDAILSPGAFSTLTKLIPIFCLLFSLYIYISCVIVLIALRYTLYVIFFGSTLQESLPCAYIIIPRAHKSFCYFRFVFAQWLHLAYFDDIYLCWSLRSYSSSMFLPQIQIPARVRIDAVNWKAACGYNYLCDDNCSVFFMFVLYICIYLRCYRFTFIFFRCSVFIHEQEALGRFVLLLIIQFLQIFLANFYNWKIEVMC